MVSLNLPLVRQPIFICIHPTRVARSTALGPPSVSPKSHHPRHTCCGKSGSFCARAAKMASKTGTLAMRRWLHCRNPGKSHIKRAGNSETGSTVNWNSRTHSHFMLLDNDCRGCIFPLRTCQFDLLFAQTWLGLLLNIKTLQNMSHFQRVFLFHDAFETLENCLTHPLAAMQCRR